MSPRKDRIRTYFDGFQESDLEKTLSLFTEDVVRDMWLTFDVDLGSQVESHRVQLRGRCRLGCRSGRLPLGGDESWLWRRRFIRDGSSEARSRTATCR